MFLDSRARVCPRKCFPMVPTVRPSRSHSLFRSSGGVLLGHCIAIRQAKTGSRFKRPSGSEGRQSGDKGQSLSSGSVTTRRIIELENEPNLNNNRDIEPLNGQWLANLLGASSITLM